MATETKLAVAKKRAEPSLAGAAFRPFETLRKEVDRLFEDFGDDFWRRPFHPFAGLEHSLSKPFAVDVTESDKAYEVTAELPGMDERDIEVNVANGSITIKGEKKEETEEKQKDYYVSERRYGAFERHFGLPESVDVDKIAATFKNGVLRVTLSKIAEAQTPARKVEVKAS